MSDAELSAVVTGAARGVGRAIAVRLLKRGYRVYALGKTVGAETLATEAGVAPEQARLVTAEMTDPADLARACRRVQGESSPSVLVNAAGITLAASLRDSVLEEVQRVFAFNLIAPLLISQTLVPGMAGRGYGRVVNVASTAGLRGFRYASAYCSSQHGLVGLTRALAHEFSGKGVTVNAICLGWADTEMTEVALDHVAAATGQTREAAREALSQRGRKQRATPPEAVADLCEFLLSPAAESVTGATYPMDGGESA